MSLSTTDHRSSEQTHTNFTAAAVVYLDALRACAANWVVLAHMLAFFELRWWKYQSGSLGVVVFFLLSGFLISQSMLKRQHGPGPRFGGFLADRVARIMTPYVPALLLVAAIDALFLSARFGGNGVSSGPMALLGNLFMLEDYPLFQLAEVGGVRLDWRIRPYNSAEPFWTVAIEMWIYVATGLLFFWLFLNEPLKRRWLLPLLCLSLPVLVWNAAAGPGKSLSLIWLAGALAGVVLAPLPRRLGRGRCRMTAVGMLSVGVVALFGHVRKYGFDAYNLQTACLIALIMFAPFLYLQTLQNPPPAAAKLWMSLAAYSYSLYLIHNTAIAVVWSAQDGKPTTAALLSCIALAHVLALVLYWAFERHYRLVGRWLRPRFEHALSAPAGHAAAVRAATPSSIDRPLG